MSSSRRRRRRLERERAKRPTRSRGLSPPARVALALGGILMVAAGIGLLGHGGSATEARLGRLAGILILVGIVLLGIGAIGRM
jgi:hypothetical protein